MSKTADDLLTEELARIARLSNADLREELTLWAANWVSEYGGFSSEPDARDRIAEAYRRRL